MVKNKIFEIYFSKDGYLVENPYRISKKNISFLLKRFISFLIDVSIIIIIQISFLLMIEDKQTRLLLSTLIPSTLLAMYYGFTLMVFKQTFGQKICGLIVTSKDGFSPEKRYLITRMIISVIFSFPFLGWLLIILSGFTALYLNGVTWLEGISKTNLITEKTHIYLINMEYENNKRR